MRKKDLEKRVFSLESQLTMLRTDVNRIGTTQGEHSYWIRVLNGWGKFFRARFEWTGAVNYVGWGIGQGSRKETKTIIANSMDEAMRIIHRYIKGKEQEPTICERYLLLSVRQVPRPKKLKLESYIF